jgi:hypothetical protein
MRRRSSSRASSPDEGGRSAAAVPTEDDAEWMSHGIGENPEAGLPLTAHPGGAEGEKFALCLIGVGHPDVEVKLLRVGRVRPSRGGPVSRALECQLPEARFGTDDHPVADVFIDPHPEYLAVELGESTGVGAVDHSLFQMADHSPEHAMRMARN